MMLASLGFAIALFLGSLVWLTRSQFAEKPWLVVGAIEDPAVLAERRPKRLGVYVLLGVLATLFALLLAALTIRAAQADWTWIPIPPVVWVNTGILVGAGISMQGAALAARRMRTEQARTRLHAAAALTLVFLFGQAVTWYLFYTAGYLSTRNPAGTFLALITVIHAIHVTAGMCFLAHLCREIRTATALDIGLCASYWHFLMGVWLLFIGLVAGGARELLILCTGG